jgi:hypothetical protein
MLQMARRSAVIPAPVMHDEKLLAHTPPASNTRGRRSILPRPGNLIAKLKMFGQKYFASTAPSCAQVCPQP